MRKILAVITTIAMVLSMSVPAFAVTIDSTEEGKNTATQTVTATYAASYTVTVSDSENGTVTADPTTAKEGDTVTLTVNPDEGYELDTLAVTYGDNQSVDVAADNTFTMPAANVTVTATFKEKQVAPTTATITEVTITVDGDSDGDYVINPNSIVTITVSGTDFDKLTENNKVEVNGTPEALTTENGWTIDAENGTATKTYAGTTFANELTLKYTNDGGTNWTDVDVTYVYEIPEVISVNIGWGDLKFTYSDDTSAWAADTDGGDKVTVANNGNVTVNAEVAYGSANGYDAIIGSFDPASATLAAEAEQVFTLTLSGAPEASLNATAIGTVTVTITESALSASITTPDDFINALSTGGNVTLGGDITVSGLADITTPTDINLNGNTLTVNASAPYKMNIASDVTLSGGTVISNYIRVGDSGTLTINGGHYETTNTSICTLFVKGGTLVINGSPTFVGRFPIAYLGSGTIDLSGFTGDEIEIFASDATLPMSAIILPVGYSAYDFQGNLLADDYITPSNHTCIVKPTE